MSSDLVSPEYTGYQLEAFIAVFTPIQVIAVALRFYARSLTVNGYGADDWLVIASLFGQFVQSGLMVAAVRQGAIGYHAGYLEETNPEAVPLFLKYLVAISSWYCVTDNLAKFAICVLYWRLFPTRIVRITISITVAVLIAASIASLIADLAGCRPFSANWAPPEVQAVQCINKEPLFIWSNFPNIVTDVVLLILPLPIVWNLKTSTQLKFALTITFAIGSLGLVTSILRFVTFANNNSFIDPTFAAVKLSIIGLAEPGTYLISACLATYRPLLEKFNIPGFKSDTKISVSRTGRSTADREHLTAKERGGYSGSDDGSVPMKTLKGTDREDDTWSLYTRQNQKKSGITITTNVTHSWMDL